MMITFKNYLIEKLKTEYDVDIDDSDHLKHQDIISKNNRYDSIHDHPDVVPQKLLNKHKDAIADFSENSRDMNYYLNKVHEKKSKLGDYRDELHQYNINTLSSAFTSENTNRKPIIAYSGISNRIGNNLLNSEANSKHTIARFISTSTDFNKALEFAHSRANDENTHLLKCYIEPNSSLSIVKHSTHPSENELLLNHGAHITYHHTTVKQNEHNNKKTFIHHITVHPTHTPLTDYFK